MQLAITAGIGSDQVDLQGAIDAGITVAEVTYCNSISVAEHVVMMILSLVCNYMPSYQWVTRGGWNIADCVARSYDVEGMVVGTVGRGGSVRQSCGGMTPHISGSSLSAQARYAAGTREILECWLEGRPIREEYLIVEGGRLAGTGARSYSPGDATGGAEDARRFTT